MFARQNLVQMKVYPKELSSHTFSSKMIAILKLIYQKQQYHYFLYVTNFPKAADETNIDGVINEKVGRLQSGNYANLKIKRKHFDCALLFKSKVHDLSAPTFMKEPFRDIPKIFYDDYSYDGRIQIRKYYKGNSFPTNRTSSK